MKKTTIASACIAAAVSLPAAAGNPFITDGYYADPSARVWNGRLYVYPSHDIDPPRGCDLMDKYHVFSTDDLVNWTDHGEIFGAKDVPWGRPEGGFMWAPDCAYRNGTYYYYFPHPSESRWNDTWRIGVATSAFPDRDFKVSDKWIDGLGGFAMIDPCVFTDDDGQSYIYCGGGQKAVGAKLKDNMVELDGPAVPMEGLVDFHEGAWVFKRKDLYYFMYPDNHEDVYLGPDGKERRRGANRQHYATAKSPLGPWTHRGIILDPTGCDTSHGSIVEFKGEWYMFYHNCRISGRGNLRSLCVDRVAFNADGTINKVVQTSAGPVAGKDGIPLTYCNPMPVPKFPVSRNCRNPKPEKADAEQFRELADPSLYVEGKTIYVYPSNSMAWRSRDRGATWEKLDIGIEDIGYAPTIVRHGGRCLVMSGRSIYSAPGPEGPFVRAGEVKRPPKPSPDVGDPMLYSEDGRLYLYYGCTPKDGIWGCEIDANTFEIVQEPRQLIPFEIETQFWEAHPLKLYDSWIEGSWMTKINGRYCLTYSSSGTEHERYAMGAAWGESPLGPFVKQRNNPFLRKTTGVVTGTSHGSLVHGFEPGELLVSYSIFSGVHHPFERLIGFDRLRLDERGELAVTEPTEKPQFTDGSGAAPWAVMPLSGPDPAFTDARIATSAPVGALPATVEFAAKGTYMVRAFRLIWRDGNMNVQKGVVPGPYRYRVERLDPADKTWKTLYDATENDVDMFVDYRETVRARADGIRLVVVGAPEGIAPAVAEFTVFCE